MQDGEPGTADVSSEIEQLKRKIEQLEAELASLKATFGDTYQRNYSAPRPQQR